jgi:hypothetical protein
MIATRSGEGSGLGLDLGVDLEAGLAFDPDLDLVGDGKHVWTI